MVGGGVIVKADQGRVLDLEASQAPDEAPVADDEQGVAVGSAAQPLPEQGAARSQGFDALDGAAPPAGLEAAEGEARPLAGPPPPAALEAAEVEVRPLAGQLLGRAPLVAGEGAALAHERLDLDRH